MILIMHDKSITDAIKRWRLAQKKVNFKKMCSLNERPQPKRWLYTKSDKLEGRLYRVNCKNGCRELFCINCHDNWNPRIFGAAATDIKLCIYSYSYSNLFIGKEATAIPDGEVAILSGKCCTSGFAKDAERGVYVEIITSKDVGYIKGTHLRSAREE